MPGAAGVVGSHRSSHGTWCSGCGVLEHRLLRVGADCPSVIPSPSRALLRGAVFGGLVGTRPGEGAAVLLGNSFGYRTLASGVSVLLEDRAAALPESDLRSADMFFLRIKRMTVTWMWCKTKAVP